MLFIEDIIGWIITYPAPGITIGPGLVFAHVATRHALASPAALGSNP